MPFLWPIGSLISMRVARQSSEIESSATLRNCLLLLLAFCALATMLATLRAVAASRDPRPSSGIAPNAFGRDGNFVSDGALNVPASTHYSVHVRVGDDSDEVVPVTAPPGGLQLQVLDMSGDNVRNDIVLRPALVHWPLIVLLNDGHDHFTVAISADLPDQVDSDTRASGESRVPHNLALVSSSFASDLDASNCRAFVPILHSQLLVPKVRRAVCGMDGIPILGRAPPAAQLS